jgi:hypothetical protein
VAQESGRDRSGKGEGAKDGDDYEFIPPDFDEDAFIHREMVSFRTTAILFVWGIVAAAVSWAAFAAMGGARTGWLVGLLIVAAFGYGLRWLFPKLGADVAHFKRRDWLGTGFLFFFTWLSFFIIAVNPPVSDYAPPRVELHASPLVQEADDAVTIDLFVEDNVRVASHTFQVTRGGQPVPGLGEPSLVGRGHYRLVAGNLTPGQYALTASATDSTGHAAAANLTFGVSERVLTVTLPSGGALDEPNDQVLVTAQGEAFRPCTVRKGSINNEPCVRTVSLVHADGGRVVLEHSEPLGGWFATRNFAGWKEGANNVTAVAETAATFAGSVRVGPGSVTAGPYAITVNGTVGSYVPDVPPEPTAPHRNVPGLGLPALAVGLLAVAVALARRR